MQVKHWGGCLLLGVVLLGSVLACQITDQFIAQAQPTPTRTRTPRPTFTPIPPPTNTLIPPSPTVPPPSPIATQRPPTARPLPTATRRPATAAPPPPPPPPGPTTSPYSWHANPPGCEHSGGVFVKARVYGDRYNPDSGLEGMRVVLGDKNGGKYDLPPVTTTWDGTYSFTLSPDGAPPYKGTVYVWLVDASLNRISDIGGPMVFNGLGPDAPGTCWHGWVDFWR